MREILVAIFGGVLWGSAFASDPIPGIGWIALAPLIWLSFLERDSDPHDSDSSSVRDRAFPVACGWLHGMFAWLTAIPWIVPTLATFGALPRVLSWLLFFLMCAVVLAPAHAAFVWLGRRLWRGGTFAAVVGLSSLWVLIEGARAFIPGFLAFPWNLAAYVWTDMPGALPLSGWIGAFGVSWLVVSVNVAAAAAWIAPRRNGELAVAVWLVVLTILAVGDRWGAGDEPTRPSVAVSVVQPNHQLQPEDGSVVWGQYQALIETSRAECDGVPRLLIWPESAGWPLVWDRDERLRRDVEDLASRGCAVLMNSPTAVGAGAWSNSAILVASDDIGAINSDQRYAKRRLVPWGETVPLEDLLPFIGKLARHAGRFEAGVDAGLIVWRGDRVAAAICYESIFPQDSAQQIRAGATLLATLSNDAWYGDSSAPRQLLRAARFRAAEARRPMARAALTGISALIAADGSILDQADLGSRTVLRGELRGRDDLSPYVRAPWLTPALASALFVVLSAWFRRR